MIRGGSELNRVFSQSTRLGLQRPQINVPRITEFSLFCRNALKGGMSDFKMDQTGETRFGYAVFPSK